MASMLAGPPTRTAATARSTEPSVARAAAASRARAGASGPASAVPSSAPRSTSSSSTPTIGRAGVSRSRASDPAMTRSPGRPGATNTGRPGSSACRAVMSAPLLAGASTTTVALARPLMMRLRRGNVPRVGMTSGACSLMTAPPVSRIAWASRRCARGTPTARPPPMGLPRHLRGPQPFVQRQHGFGIRCGSCGPRCPTTGRPHTMTVGRRSVRRPIDPTRGPR